VPTCQDCGSFVTPRFARVFGDNDGNVFGCNECLSFRGLTKGEGAAPEA
jgi:hypothetical protein